MWWILGAWVGSASAGDVWVTLDDSKRHLEVPAVWLLDADGEPTLFDTQDGRIDLGVRSKSLKSQRDGAKESYRLADGTLTLVHRVPAVRTPKALSLELGMGFRMEVELGEGSAQAAVTGIDAALDLDGIELHIEVDDLLAPLRRAAPTRLYEGTNAKGKTVRIELI